MTKDRADLQVPETTRELLLQTEAIEQGLEQDQTRKGGQALGFEADCGNAMGFVMNAGFAKLHTNGLCWLIRMVWRLQFYQFKDRFFIAASHLPASFLGDCWNALSVNSCRRAATCS
jgi:hypothetical protein